MAETSMDRLCYATADLIAIPDSQKPYPSSSTTARFPIALMDPGRVYILYLRQCGVQVNDWAMKNGGLSRSMDQRLNRLGKADTRLANS